MKAKINNIELTIGDKTYNWSLEEAEAILAALNGLLKRDIVWPKTPYVPPSKMNHPLPPYPSTPYKPAEIWCGAGPNQERKQEPESSFFEPSNFLTYCG